MVAICFIPLLCIGLVMLWLIWDEENGPYQVGDHAYMTVFLKKQNLVLDYNLLNGEIERSDSFEVTEQSVITWWSVGSTEYPSRAHGFEDRSTDESMVLPQSFCSREIQKFADYLGIDYMPRYEWEESN